MKIHLVMSLPAMTFGDRFCFSRKGGIGGGGWMYLNSADSMTISGFSFRNALVGSRWATAVLLCTNKLTKQSSRLARHPFLVGKPFSQSGQTFAS